MKKATYISVFIGFLFLTISLFAFLLDKNYDSLFLPLGIGVLLLISLPLFFLQLNDRSKKMKSVAKQHRATKKRRKESVKKSGNKSAPDYPSFGERKSGLKWGGGNIHASTAKRGSKRGFLER